MKKILVVLIVALVVLTSASAFKFKSVGLELGSRFIASSAVAECFVNVDMEVIDNLDVYAGMGYAAGFAITSGAEYKVASFDVGGIPVAVRPGLQMNVFISEGYTYYAAMLACSLSFETQSLGAFIRPSTGLLFASDYSDFNFDLQLGISYLFQ